MHVTLDITPTLSECHFRNDGQHDLFAFCWVRVFSVLIEPSFERASSFSCCIFPSRTIQVHTRIPVCEIKTNNINFVDKKNAAA